jgi:hypothetical protein
MARKRKRGAGPSRPRVRDKRHDAQARETQAAQRASARKQMTVRQYQLRRGFGWGLVGLAIAIGVSHWLAHLGLWRFASPGVMDLTAGYPMALLLGIAGAIVLGRLSR